jgi:hypothetical protein
MKHIPTCLIVKIPTCKHIFGKIWFDTEARVFVKGDKTPKQKKRELKKKGLTDCETYSLLSR